MVPFGNGFLQKLTSPLLFSEGIQSDVASYIIFQSVSTIKAQNGNTKRIDYQGTNAATVINNAIQALSSTGGRIFLKEGTYNLSASINLNIDNLIFESNASLFNKQNYNGNIFNISGTNIIAGNFRVNGNRSTATFDNQGISISGSRIHLKDIFITDIVHHGVNTPGASEVTLENIRVENTGVADGGVFAEADGVGIVIGANSTNVKLINCTTYKTGYHGFQVYDTTSQVFFINCIAYQPGQTLSTGSGLKINPNTSDVYLSNCYFSGVNSGNNSHGILMLTEASSPVDNIHITNTTVTGFGLSGIEIEGVTNVTIDENTHIFNNGVNASASVDYGIRIIDGTGGYTANHITINAKIYDNQTIPTQAQPIGIYDSSTNILIDGLEAYGHTSSNAIYYDSAATGTVYYGRNFGGLGRFDMSGTEPRLILHETNTGANAKRWDIRADAGTLYIRTLSDNDATQNNLMHFTRSGSIATGVVVDVDLTVSSATTITAANSSNDIPLTINQNDTTNNPMGLIVNNTGTNSALRVYESGNTGGTNGIIFENDGTGAFVIIQQDGNLANGRYGLRVYSNTNQTGNGFLAEVIQDNASSVQTATRLYNDGTGTNVFIDTNNTGKSIEIDHDANSASEVKGLTIDVANAGAGGSTAIEVTSGVSKLLETQIKAGNSSGTIAKAGGVIDDEFADSTVGGAEADIYTYTTPASILNTNGDKVIASYGGNFVTLGTESVQLKAYFAGTAIWDSTAIQIATGTTSWAVSVEIIRVSSTVVRYTVRLNTTGASGFTYCTVGELTGLTLSNTNILKITGTSTGVGSGSGDIVGKMGFVQWKPAA